MSESDTPEQSKYIRHRQTWKPLHYMEIVVFCFKRSRKNSYHSALLLLKFWNFLNVFAQKKFVQQKKNMNWNGTFTNRSQPVCCLLAFSLPILYTLYSILVPKTTGGEFFGAPSRLNWFKMQSIRIKKPVWVQTLTHPKSRLRALCSSIRYWEEDGTVARSHLGFPANLIKKKIQQNREKILHAHIKIF